MAPPTPDVIVRALGSLGIAGINQVLRNGEQINFPSPVREDGPGWRFEVDLPYGVTATQVIERREQFASGLRRPLGAVWPEVVSHEHAGRLEGWVGRVDISRARPAPWPWLRTGGGNVFGPLPFGVSPRQRRVDVSVIEHNWLIGSMPGQGKTSAVRVLVAAASLDPTVEMWIHELKGTGDLDWFEPCCHRFISGIDDESIGYAAESLKLLRAEVMKRSARLKKVQAEHRELCPDKKITREIANRRGLRLWPLLAAFDELQNLFAHPKYGKQAGEDATFVIKIGRALGVFLVLATQRPDKESLPTGISGNVSTRFCLKVAGQVENDMILGTSAYKNGARATTFRPKVDAGLGYLKGEENVPQVVRTYYLNDADTERVARRARALREAAGTLSGAALGEDDRREERDVRADLAAVAGTENGLHWAEAAGRLAERFPERWAGATADSVSAEARGQGIASVDVRRPGWRGQGCPAPGRDLMSGAAVAGRAGMCSAGATAADQPERQAAATCSGRAPRLACDVAADAARPGITGQLPHGGRISRAGNSRDTATPEGTCLPPRPRGILTWPRDAPTSTARGCRAACTRRVTGTATTTGTGTGMRTAARLASRRATRRATRMRSSSCSCGK